MRNYLRTYTKYYKIFSIIFIIFFVITNIANASSTVGVIDPDNDGSFTAQIENTSLGSATGINFGKFSNQSSKNITVTNSEVRGYAWGEGVGWIVTNCADTTSGCSSTNGNFKISNDGTGLLSGYAWGENTGWINFGPFTNSSISRVKITTGVFGGTTGSVGYAWSQNFGWIRFDCSSASSCVKTDWRPIVISIVSGGGGGTMGNICLINPASCMPPPDTCATNPELCVAPPDTCFTNPELCLPPPPDTCVTNPSICVMPPETCATNPELCVVSSSTCNTNPELCVITSNICLTNPELCLLPSDTCATNPSICIPEPTFCTKYPEKCLPSSRISGYVNGIVTGVASGIMPLLINPLWLLVLVAFGIRKNKKPWGVVYDSITKQPISSARVTLIDMRGNEVAAYTTDSDGRYGFLVPIGMYKIIVNKTNHTFPSQIIAEKSNDELHDNLYFGETIAIAKEEKIITKNIPLDHQDFNWNEYITNENQHHRHRDTIISSISNTIFVAGFIFTVLVVVINSSLFNIIVMSLYFILGILKIGKPNDNPKGTVSSSFNKKPIPFSTIRIISKKTNLEVGRSVVNSQGEYYALVPNGIYDIIIDKNNCDISCSSVHIKGSIVVKKGYLKENFKI